MAELRPYEPTWRDRLAQMMMGDGRASPERRRFVEGILGSSGLGNTGMGVVDVTPVGGLLQAQEAVQEGDPRGAALAVLPIPGAARARAAANVAADAAAPQGIRAYHGSPHDFDRFSMSKIGTGEGAQAYGHGLYFAGNEPVAMLYRGNAEERYRRLSGHMSPKEEYAFDLATRSGDIRDMDVLSGLAQKYGNNISFDEANELARKAVQNRGRMYEVNIRANPENFLDWEKPISEQSPMVRDALSKAGINKKDIFGGDAWFRAQRIKGYAVKQDPAGQWGPGANTLEESLAMVDGDKSRVRPLAGVTPEDRSAALRDAGIPGIKYFDARARAAGEEARNYVVFDENLIDILRKYGLVPGMIGGGAAAGSFGLLGPEGQSEY